MGFFSVNDIGLTARRLVLDDFLVGVFDLLLVLLLLLLTCLDRRRDWSGVAGGWAGKGGRGGSGWLTAMGARGGIDPRSKPRAASPGG